MARFFVFKHGNALPHALTHCSKYRFQHIVKFALAFCPVFFNSFHRVFILAEYKLRHITLRAFFKICLYKIMHILQRTFHLAGNHFVIGLFHLLRNPARAGKAICAHGKANQIAQLIMQFLRTVNIYIFLHRYSNISFGFDNILQSLPFNTCGRRQLIKYLYPAILL